MYWCIILLVFEIGQNEFLQIFKAEIASWGGLCIMEPVKNKIIRIRPDGINGKRVKRALDLEVAAFTCGASVVAMELVAARVVAPYIGTSIIVWMSLIGVVLASLSLGHWLGGKAADIRPDQKILARIVLLSSIFTAVMALLSNPILWVLSRNVANVYLSSLIASLVLFAPPSVLLGMVYPFIVRLSIRDIGSSGAVIGRFSALSSAGNILGILLGGFVLISFLSTGTILLLIAAVLAFVALMLYRSTWKKAIAFGVIFLALACGVSVWGMPMMPLGAHVDTPYNRIWITEIEYTNERRIRFLTTDSYRGFMFTDNPAELVRGYARLYDLAFHYKPDTERILMLGGGGYSVPRHLLATRLDDYGQPAFSMDIVEIDPGITAAARKYFYLQDSPALSIYHEDARVFINRAAMNPDLHGVYDAIFTNVFGSWYSIPFHMTTVEAARRMYDILAPDGVLITNVISSLHGRQSGILHGIYAAKSQVFSQVLIFPQHPEPQFAHTRQNIMLVALKTPAPHFPPRDAETALLLSHRWTEPFVSDVRAFTDAFAPVERYALRN